MTVEAKASLIDRLGRYYHSDYVKHNRPDVLSVPFEEWLRRQLIRIGGVL